MHLTLLTSALVVLKPPSESPDSRASSSGLEDGSVLGLAAYSSALAVVGSGCTTGATGGSCGRAGREGGEGSCWCVV